MKTTFCLSYNELYEYSLGPQFSSLHKIFYAVPVYVFVRTTVLKLNTMYFPLQL
jgi:hypothetical protein